MSTPVLKIAVIAPKFTADELLEAVQDLRRYALNGSDQPDIDFQRLRLRVALAIEEHFQNLRERAYVFGLLEVVIGSPFASEVYHYAWQEFASMIEAAW